MPKNLEKVAVPDRAEVGEAEAVGAREVQAGAVAAAVFRVVAEVLVEGEVAEAGSALPESG